MSTTHGPGAFAVFLQQHRARAGLSQEELAERAGLSRRGVSDLERGYRRLPHPATVRRLAETLGLAESDRAAFLVAARAANASAVTEADRCVEGAGKGTPPSPLAESAGLVLHKSSQPPLVARERELAVLTDRLAAAALGGLGVVLLRGEPGVGKTGLMTEMAKRAAASGWEVLRGAAFVSEGTPPYLPFLEALHRYVRASQIDDLRQQLGATAPDVAHVLPDLARKLPRPPARRAAHF